MIPPEDARLSRLVAPCAVLFLFAAALALPAAEAPKEPAPKPETAKDKEDKPAEPVPVRIEADEIERENDLLTFTGNVIATRGGTIVYCDKMVSLIEQIEVKDAKTGKITMRKQPASIVATGRVNILQQADGRHASAEKADYSVKTAKIILSGAAGKRPRLWDGEMTTIADKITFDLNDNRVFWHGRPAFSFDPKDRPKLPEPPKPQPPAEAPAKPSGDKPAAKTQTPPLKAE